jgi:DNA-binding response OmpR family regulator
MQHAVCILVWDLDDPLTVKRVTEAVEAYQSAVIPCSSAEGVLFAIQHKTVDVVILSLQKPFKKAFNLLSEIKTKASQVEVIFVSEFDDDGYGWKRSSAGLTSFYRSLWTFQNCSAFWFRRPKSIIR